MNDFKDVWKQKNFIFYLAKNDFKTKYAGSFLGIVWAFIQPLVTILVYTIVFQFGLKSGGVDGVPFVLWLMAGLIPWFFFQEALINTTNSFVEYSYLVNKIKFDIGNEYSNFMGNIALLDNVGIEYINLHQEELA